MKSKRWIKAGLVLSTIYCFVWLSPAKAIDPWNLFSPKKILTMIFALTVIQTLSSLARVLLGYSRGAILTGFLGGLISSTATIASVARKSMESSSSHAEADHLIFLSATLAMLVEALAITIFGVETIHSSLFVIFAGPILATIVMIVIQSRPTSEPPVNFIESDLDILAILKLSAFVIGILTLSKILQNLLGTNGLLILTFLASLFEIHGSVIANVQLHESETISVAMLGGLLAISVAASFCSKFFLIFTLSNSALKARVLKSTAILAASLSFGYLAFCFLM